MFDVGFWELVILFGLGLVILGPERLPKVAMQIGNWAGQARRMARTLTNQMRAEMDFDVNKPFSPPKSHQSYNRPGMDDLKPGSGTESEYHTGENLTDEPHAEDDADDRDHSDAGSDPADSDPVDVGSKADDAAKPA